MFYEYAVDPAAVTTRRDAAPLLDAFGPAKGRFIALLPADWEREVWERAKKACRPKERQWFVERLRRARDEWAFAPRPAAVYERPHSWLENALREHGREPFRAIITAAAPRPGAPVLLAEELEESQELWAVPASAFLPRDPATIAAALGLLFRLSREVAIIDPHFRAEDEPKRAMLSCIAASVGSRATIDVHTGIKDLKVHESAAMAESAASQQCRQAATKLPGELVKDRTVTLHHWRQRAGGQRLHNRYIVTDIGGVELGDGLERGDPGQEDRVSILSAADRRKIWSAFYNVPGDYDRVSVPLAVLGTR